jgi:hypothetical protein
MNKPLIDYKFRWVSQNGEDGIIAEIVRRLGLGNDLWCCEFGAWDGVFLSNTFHLVRTTNTKVVMIEGDSERFQKLLETSSKYPNIIPLNYNVSFGKDSENTLDKILLKTEIPFDFDVLSIDVDSYDLDIWESLSLYHPKLVIIEINNEIKPGIFQRHSDVNWLNSFSSTIEVAKTKKYTLVCHCFNLFFIRNDLIDKISLDKKFIETPELLFDWKWVNKLEWSIRKEERRKFKKEKTINGNS